MLLPVPARIMSSVPLSAIVRCSRCIPAGRPGCRRPGSAAGCPGCRTMSKVSFVSQGGVCFSIHLSGIVNGLTQVIALAGDASAVAVAPMSTVVDAEDWADQRRHRVAARRGSEDVHLDAVVQAGAGTERERDVGWARPTRRAPMTLFRLRRVDRALAPPVRPACGRVAVEDERGGAGERAGVGRVLRLAARRHEHADVDGQRGGAQKRHEADADEHERHPAIRSCRTRRSRFIADLRSVFGLGSVFASD